MNTIDKDDEFDDVMNAIGDDEDAIAALASEGPADGLIDGVGFADPGGKSALRRATRSNPRDLPCPECGKKNRLTPLDVRAGYCCDDCADAKEGGS